jgi:hypothetical protein
MVFDSAWGVIPPSHERNTAWNRGRKFFHCLGAPYNLIRPWPKQCSVFGSIRIMTRDGQPFAETWGRIWNALINPTTILSICWPFYNDTTRCSVQLSRFIYSCGNLMTVRCLIGVLCRHLFEMAEQNYRTAWDNRCSRKYSKPVPLKNKSKLLRRHQRTPSPVSDALPHPNVLTLLTY